MVARKVFSRWVNQKLYSTHGIKVDDIVTSSGDPMVLIKLAEELSEKKFSYKIAKAAKLSRIQEIETATYLLKFIFEDCGVELKIKPSAESLVDKDEKSILTIVWALMNKFLKFGDETDGLDAKSSLILWINNQIANHNLKPVSGFGKEWHDGKALCAILHKNRPRLINWDSVSNESDNRKNIKAAFDAAQKYFDLEQYLTIDDFLKLDEKALMIYVSDYYLGVAEARKIDQASRRIGKLVKLTVENDELRAEYNSRSKDLLVIIDRTKILLEDRTIDNTMQGAKNRLEQFYEYKANDKNKIIEHQLSLESLYNNLAIRLSHNKRPEFKPNPGCSLNEINDAIRHLEECESERKFALHAELNRQIKLVHIRDQHRSHQANLMGWIKIKSEYLNKKQVVESVSAAELQLRLLDAYGKELESIRKQNISKMLELGLELEREKYEYLAELREQEAMVHNGIKELEKLEAIRRPVASDDLEREKFKLKVRSEGDQHQTKYSKLLDWVKIKDGYLKVSEKVESVSDARRHLSNLDLYQQEQKAVESNAFEELKKLGAHVLSQKYSTQHSSWQWEDPSIIKTREDDINTKFNDLSGLALKKRQVLDKALELELQKESLRMEWAHLSLEYVSWIKDVTENISTFSHFGFTLDEVQAHQSVLDKSDQDFRSTSQSKIQLAKDVDSKLKSLNVLENKYSSLKVDDLDNGDSSLNKSMECRRQAYKKELDRQIKNDSLCKEFANLVEPINKFINENKNQISTSKKDLNGQLDDLNSFIADLPKHAPEIQKVNEVFASIEQAGITNNKYTILTAKDVEVTWNQYNIFLQKKKSALDEEVANEKLKGLTVEQLNDIKNNFSQFDRDGDGKLNPKELKACLYSLGEEKHNSEIEKIIQQYGSDGNLSREAFTEFAIHLYGDSDTKDEILSGFKLINKGQDQAHHDKIELVLKESDFEYFTKTAPKISDGVWNYQAWTDDVFSR